MNIDEIYDMIYWKNEDEIQKKGIEMAKKIKHIDCFIMPLYEKGISRIGLWENCAIIIASHSDEELEMYIPRLLNWLKDLNWPGAMTIFERLSKFKNKSKIVSRVDFEINCVNNPDSPRSYINNLNELKDELMK